MNLLPHEYKDPEPGVSHYLLYISSEAVTFSEISEKLLRFKVIFLSHVFLTYSSAPFLTKYLISQCRVVIWTLFNDRFEHPHSIPKETRLSKLLKNARGI